MAWCPKCKSEYTEGVTRCPDCDVELVDTLSLKEELLDSLKPYTFKEDFTMQDLVDELDGSDKKPKAAKLYKSAEERYADARSSAFSFLLVGGLGLVATVLDIVGVFDFPFHGFAVYTMAAVFAVFVLISFASMKNAKKLLAAIGEEHAQIQAIQTWYQTDGIHADALAALEERFTDEPEEARYLQKYEIVRTLLKGQFPEVEEALLDKLASDFCEEAWESFSYRR